MYGVHGTVQLVTELGTVKTYLALSFTLSLVLTETSGSLKHMSLSCVGLFQLEQKRPRMMSQVVGSEYSMMSGRKVSGKKRRKWGVI